MAQSVIVFDVNETLSDMSEMAQHFEELGAPEEAAATWFASLLRDGFALTAAGVNPKFLDVADAALRSALAVQRLNRPIDDAVAHLLGCLKKLSVHADVPDAVVRLSDAGHRLVTLTNGGTAMSGALLERAGVRDRFEALLTVEDAPLWKPAAAAYRYAADTCGTPLQDMVLVAVHPWDIDGAARSGMQTAWVNRSGAPYPAWASTPTYSPASMTDFASRIITDNRK